MLNKIPSNDVLYTCENVEDIERELKNLGVQDNILAKNEFLNLFMGVKQSNYFGGENLTPGDEYIITQEDLLFRNQQRREKSK